MPRKAPAPAEGQAARRAAVRAPSKELQAFPNPQPARDYVIRFDVPEFTCLCPLTGQPDFAHFRIEIVADKVLRRDQEPEAVLLELPQRRCLPREGDQHAESPGLPEPPPASRAARSTPAPAGCSAVATAWRCEASRAARRCCPVNGTREALFAFAQTVVDPNRSPAPPWSAPTRSIRSTKARPCWPARRRPSPTATRRATSPPTGQRSTRPPGRARSCCTSARRATPPAR
jgi:hypothetical protein